MTRTSLHIVFQASLALVAASVFDDNALLQVVNTSTSGEEALSGLEMYDRLVRNGQAFFLEFQSGIEHCPLPCRGALEKALGSGCTTTCKGMSYHTATTGCLTAINPGPAVNAERAALEEMWEKCKGCDGCIAEADRDVTIPDEEKVFQDSENISDSHDSARPSRVVGTGLENLDWSDGVRDGTYDMPTNAGQNVNVYVADTGVNCWHADFRTPNRCIKVFDYFDNIRAPTPTSRCLARSRRCGADKQGHGTHCAGTVAGEVHGQAGSATIAAVKVLGDTGSGYTTGIILGIEQSVEHCTGGSSTGQYNCVISMSLGGSGVTQSYEVAIGNALSRGVVTTVAAGNSNADACNYSPAFAPSAITVGSCQDSGPGSTTVAMSSFSNYGSCVDIFAIGSSVKSSDNRYKSGSRTMSGTSMACPGVAGAVAIYHAWYQNLNGNQIRTHAVDAHIANMITGIPGGTNTPNKFMCIWKGKKNNRCGR